MAIANRYLQGHRVSSCLLDSVYRKQRLGTIVGLFNTLARSTHKNIQFLII